MSATKEFLAAVRVLFFTLFIIVGVLAAFERVGKSPDEAIDISRNFIKEQVSYITDKYVEFEQPAMLVTKEYPIPTDYPVITNPDAPRGVHNNNPLNLRISSANNWKGELSVNTDGAFEQFETAAWGFRAAAKTIITYQTKYGLDTINDIIYRFAPPTENNTDNYVAFVSSKLGIDPNQPIDVKSNKQLLAELVHTMSIMEVGYHYSYEEALIGVSLATSGLET